MSLLALLALLGEIFPLGQREQAPNPHSAPREAVGRAEGNCWPQWPRVPGSPEDSRGSGRHQSDKICVPCLVPLDVTLMFKYLTGQLFFYFERAANQAEAACKTSD